MQHSLILSTRYLGVFHKIVIDERRCVADLHPPAFNPQVLAKTRAVAL
jgi:hypothetical protein